MLENQIRELEKQLQIQNQEKAKIEAKLRSAIDQLQIIQKIESNILEAESAGAIAEIALRNLNAIVPCKSSAVTLFDLKYQFGQLLAGFNTDRKPGSRYVLTDSPVREELYAGKSVILNDLNSIASKYPVFQSVVENGGQSIMIVPMFIQGEIIGSINLVSGLKNAFSEREKEIVNQISKSLAVAIQNAQIVQTEKKARREADILREVAANINTQVDQETLLEQILIQLAHVLPYDSASILQYEDEKLIVTARHGALSYENIKDLFNPIPPNLAKLIATKKPMFIPDTQNYPDWRVIPQLDNTRCWLGVPLLAKGSFFGILTLVKSEPYFYNEQSANLALAFANHAAIAIENARLYRETQKFGEKMQQQVALRMRDLSALYEITAITSQFTDLQSILDRVATKISSTLECERLILYMVDDSQEKLHLACSIGLPSEHEQLARQFPIDHPLIRVMRDKNEPYFTKGGDPDPLTPGAKLPPGIKNGLGCPINYKGKFFGILGLINKKQPFNREDIALISSITDQIGIAIENDQLRKQSERAVVTQERKRLARDLHDSITQSLFSLTMFAAAAREYLRNGSIVDAEDFLTDIAITSNQTYKEMRLLLYELQPSTLTKEGLVGALRLRLDAVENRSGIKATFSKDLTTTLSPNVERALFYIANEALNNTLKHSQATTVSIAVESHDNLVRMEVKDNGIGFEAGVDDQDSRMGLTSMKQRIASINGIFRCRTAPGKGTTIIVKAPIS